jgi:TRAP-type uncharacterized transport system substrate-binding protein
MRKCWNTVKDAVRVNAETGASVQNIQQLVGGSYQLAFALADTAADVAAQRLDLTKTVDGMKDGSIDALFWSGGLPTPGITDLVTSARNDVVFIDITTQLVKMQDVSPASVWILRMTPNRCR